MAETFVHLHLHSEFSLADGIVRLPQLAQSCARLTQPAVALTDISNLCGAVKFYRACLSAGVKPIIGCDVWIENPHSAGTSDRAALYCMDQDGYRNLSRLLTDAYLRGSVNNKVVISWQDLAARNKGLICLIDDHEGLIANTLNQGMENQLSRLIHKYKEVFINTLYFAISRTGRRNEENYIHSAVESAAGHDIGLVAVNRVVFIGKEDFEAHEIRVCINNGRVLEDSRRPRNYTDQQYLKSTEEMAEIFSDIPSAISNALEIAKRCNLFLNFDQDFLPDYPDAGGRSEASLLRKYAESGLARRLKSPAVYSPDGAPAVDQKYIDRLNMELEVIESMGYSGYFLIVSDFIKWSRENDIPVGPGRGSGAGSLVAWATGITELDPLLYGLIFERFLNPERVSLPDFDIDFCVDGRDKVIDYVMERYGHDQVAQIITFGTMAAKAVVRDVGRVMGFPYGFIDQIAKLIPFEVGMTLQKALSQEQLLQDRYDNEADVQELIDASLQLEGIARNAGKHAGGVVIAPGPLTEYTPLYSDVHLNQAITQLDKDDLEAIGLVKFDFLGLRTLTIIDCAMKMINQRKSDCQQELLNLDTLALDDEDTYKFIGTGQTTAIFQLESRGMRELIMRAHPQTFEDLVALIAMFRPGPLQSGMVEDFVNRKAGREPIRYLHPELEPILSTTCGVILYQEQVMEIARSMAGYTLGGADLLRKAMGKKLPGEMAKQRETFVAGSAARGIDRNLADSIFTLMDKFAGYGFNKSHSAAYALISYQTAWLKTHYPADFMAATLSADMDNTDKVVTLLADAKSMGLRILPPDINSGFHTFRPVTDAKITYGLGAVKGVGKGVVESIVDEREKNGGYESLLDFCQRLDMRKINKRVLEALIKSGAMDALGAHRASLMGAIGSTIKAADQRQQNLQAGQFDMFGVEDIAAENPEQSNAADWSEEERLAAEKETLGLYLTGHPYHRYARELNTISEHDAPGLDLSTPRNGIFAGIMIAMRVLKARRGKMAFITLDNAEHRVEVSLFSEKLNEYLGKLQKDNVLIAIGEFSADEYTGGCQMRAEKILDIDEVRKQCLVEIELSLHEDRLDSDRIRSLQAVLKRHRGGEIGVSVRYSLKSGETGHLNFGDAWKVGADETLFRSLEADFGADSVSYRYVSDVLHKSFAAQPAYRHKAAVNH